MPLAHRRCQGKDAHDPLHTAASQDRSGARRAGSWHEAAVPAGCKSEPFRRDLMEWLIYRFLYHGLRRDAIHLSNSSAVHQEDAVLSSTRVAAWPAAPDRKRRQSAKQNDSYRAEEEWKAFAAGGPCG